MPTIATTDWLAIKGMVSSMMANAATVAPAIAGFAVYDPDTLITPNSDASGPLPFITLSHVTNDPDRGGRIDPRLIERSGTLMISIQWPVSRPITGTQLIEMAGQIEAYFPADTCMTYGPSRLRVLTDAGSLPAYVEGAYRVKVVRVFWSSK